MLKLSPSVRFVLRAHAPLRLEKAIDRSKLAPKQIIDKNGHRKTVYVRMEIPMKKEPWYSTLS